MLDVKLWLESTEMKVAEQCFKRPPALPYITFLESNEVDGADCKNCIQERNISIELYSDKINKVAEEKIERLLNEKSIKYKKNRVWIESEKFFQTVYDFYLLEKF